MPSTDTNYRIIQQLGAGIAGRVFLAESGSGNVAIRLYQSGVSAGVEDSFGRATLRESVSRSAALNIPGAARTLEFIEEGSDIYLVMEHIPYPTLESLISQTEFPRGRSLDCLRQAAISLNYAHQAGLTHGDVKPSNIFISSDNLVRVADFGISPRGRRELPTLPAEWEHAYLAPEHFSQREAIGPATDQYSLAAIAHHLYLGHPPSVRVSASRLAKDLSGLSRPSRAALAKALAADPRQRFSSCIEFVNAFGEDVQTEIGVVTSKSRALYLMVAGVALACFLAVLIFTANHETKPKKVEQRDPPPVEPPKYPPPVEPPKYPPPPVEPSTGLSASKEKSLPVTPPVPPPKAVDPISSRDFEIQLFSRDRMINQGDRFSYGDQELGEMAQGDLKAKIVSTVRISTRRLKVKWFVNNVPMASNVVLPNREVEYGNEPTRGDYRVVLLKDDKELKTFTFTITK